MPTVMKAVAYFLPQHCLARLHSHARSVRAGADAPGPGDQTTDGPPQFLQIARLGYIGLRAGAHSLPTVGPGGVGRAKNDGSIRIKRANFSAEFKGVSVFTTIAEQIEIDPLDPRQLQTFPAGVGGRYSILGVAEIQLEHLYAVGFAFDYQNVFSWDLQWVSLAGAGQMLTQAVRRLLNAPPHGKKRGSWIE
jgi:hypothetical protein